MEGVRKEGGGELCECAVRVYYENAGLREGRGMGPSLPVWMGKERVMMWLH